MKPQGCSQGGAVKGVQLSQLHQQSCKMHQQSCKMHQQSCKMHQQSCKMHQQSCKMHQQVTFYFVGALETSAPPGGHP